MNQSSLATDSAGPSLTTGSAGSTPPKPTNVIATTTTNELSGENDGSGDDAAGEGNSVSH